MNKKYLQFPNFNNQNIKLYYVLTAFMNGWFILPNWVFYYAQYTTIIKIGIIDGVSKLIGIALEVPSGAVSDLLGKKNTLIAGNIFFIICCLVLLKATNFTGLLIGNIIMFIGFACISGAKEALLYDSLIDSKKEDHYDEVLGKVNSIAIATTIFAIFAGGWLFKINPKLTFIAWIMFSIISVVILIFIKEPLSDEKHLSFTMYFSKLKTGVNSIFQKPKISFVLPVLFFSMLIKSYEGIIRQNTGAYFGFNGETFGYLMALISIPALIVSYNYNKIASYLKNKTEHLFIGLYGLGFLIVFITNNVVFGIASFLSVYIAQEIVKPYITGMVNKNTLSKHRATALSTVSLFSEFPYMVITIFFGAFIETDMIRYLYSAFIAMLVIYLLLRQASTSVNSQRVSPKPNKPIKSVFERN